MLSSLVLPKLLDVSVCGSAELFNVPNAATAAASCVPHIIHSTETYMRLHKEVRRYFLCIFQPPAHSRPARWFLYPLDTQNPQKIFAYPEEYLRVVLELSKLCNSSGANLVSLFICCSDFGRSKVYGSWLDFASWFGFKPAAAVPNQDETLVREMIACFFAVRSVGQDNSFPA